MKTATHVGDERWCCRQEKMCQLCGKAYRQQKTKRIKCKCGGLLTQRTVK